MTSIINLGILAHVDAGKTSLTERLLQVAGVIDEVGSVDRGNTVTDSLALERERGITIKAAVTSFSVADVRVNLIDTPGHPDFIAEVERVLRVLDGAVLVVSAVEGVQPQTRILARTLQRLRIPMLVFINKLDRRGADPDRVLAQLSSRLHLRPVSMGKATAVETRQPLFTAFTTGDPVFVYEAVDRLSQSDEALLDRFLSAEQSISATALSSRLADQTAAARVHPVFLGSAITGTGVSELISGILTLLPQKALSTSGELSGSVFKIDRGPRAEKLCYVRLFSGSLHPRDKIGVAGGGSEKVTGVHVFRDGAVLPTDVLQAGEIGLVRGLERARIGDSFGAAAEAAPAATEFAPPTLETVVEPADPSDKVRMMSALSQLAEQDPLIGLRQDDTRQEIYLSLYGEVQKEVIESTLQSDFGVHARFRETSVICIERPVGAGIAVEYIATGTNPYLATVGVRVEYDDSVDGVAFGLEVELGAMPRAFFNATEEAVRAALQRGLCGWDVQNCRVTMTHSGYWARQSHAHATFDKNMSSTAKDFRLLTPVVVMRALHAAGTRVFEPVNALRLEIPDDLYVGMLPALSRHGVWTTGQEQEGSTAIIFGEMPAARVHGLQTELPTLTRGEGVLETDFLRYSAVQSDRPVPKREWSGASPLDERNYYLTNRR